MKDIYIYLYIHIHIVSGVVIIIDSMQKRVFLDQNCVRVYVYVVDVGVDGVWMDVTES